MEAEMGAEVEKKEMRGIETMTVQVPWKAILRFSIPLFIGSLFQQIYSIADAVIVGRLVGVKELAGVGATGAMSFLVIGFATGITSGFSVVIAQRAGAGKKEQIRTSVAACGWLCAAVTAVMTLLSAAGADPLLRLMNTPEDIFQYASGYIGIIFGGLGAAIYYNMTAGILRAVGDSRTPLYFLIFSSVLNVVLDLAAVLVFQGGVEGAAWATVLAQLLSVALCLLYLARRYPQLLFRREDRRLDRGLLRRTVSYGAVSALHQSSLYIGKLLVQGAVNSMGTPMISAYTATTRIEGFANSFGDSGAQAVSVFTAQNTGAGEERRVREGFRTSFLMMLALGAVMSVLLYAAAPAAIALLAGETSSFTQTNGVAYLRMVGCFYILCFLGNTFVGYFRGRGQVTVPVYGTIIQISARVILSYALIRPMGLSGVALATGLGWVLVVSFHSLMYWRTRNR